MKRIAKEIELIVVCVDAKELNHSGRKVFYAASAANNSILTILRVCFSASAIHLIIKTINLIDCMALRPRIRFRERAPHPNAGRLAIDWFLSREGQRIYQKVFAEGGTSGGNSMRE